MTDEYCFFDRSQPFPYTPAWYADRKRAAHLEQPTHRGRLIYTAQLAHQVMSEYGISSIVDLGAGDGGLLSLMSDVRGWGYDLQPENILGAEERGVNVRLANVLDEPIEWGRLAVATEMLEHLEDPHAFVRYVGDHVHAFIASSPPDETPECHYELHTWGWTEDGYVKLIEQGGFTVVKYDACEAYQIIVGVKQ